ncbi:hypothetical protein [uncultured Desulfovibrio sp.]|uniref:hypothetical protein n=1 Tax=uncultured Desulfovibrio sp. TaxID=167968 RepID=UPI00272B6AF2|nr:hypothetical protein [uncultured Desulfovibrio sp.]
MKEKKATDVQEGKTTGIAMALYAGDSTPLEAFVNTNSQNHLASMVHMQSGSSVTIAAAVESDSGTDASILLPDRASRALQNLARDGNELSQALEERLDSLQESFMALLQRQMNGDKLHLEERLHLYLSPEGCLVVEGSDTDTEKVCAIISRKPALQRRFQELARLALLSHGVEVACQAHTALQKSEQETGNTLFSRYHMCLKGALSHFYVR